MSKDIRIGISGWTYPDWKGVFYPKKMPAKDELVYASRQFNSIEVNGTFYRLQKPHTFENWYSATPDHFSFAIKAPKYVTHERRLNDVAVPIANFFASGILLLKEKLGPILWQLPPNLSFDPNRIGEFLRLLPKTTLQACEIGKGHSDWMAERAMLETDLDRPIHHAVEVRNHSFITKEFIDLMREHQVAIVVGDTAGRWPLIEEVTASFVYIRLHGDEVLFPTGYSKSALAGWVAKIRAFAEQSEAVYVFCDNDYKTAAPENAAQLMASMNIDWQAHARPDAPLKPKKTSSKKAANNRTVSKTKRVRSSKNKALG